MKTIILMAILSLNIYSMTLDKVENYRIYYGKIKEVHIEELSKYDLVVVEGKFLTKEMVEELQRNDTLVFAYASVIEVGAWDNEFRKGLVWSDYIKRFIFYKKDGANRLGNIGRRNYRKELLKLINDRGISKGVDGIFLDTVDWIDAYKRDNEKFYRKLLVGYNKFLLELREENKDILILQNRGFYTLNNIEENTVDIVLWENFDVHSSRYERREKILKDFEKQGKTILTLHFKNDGENRKKSLENNWIPLYQETRFSKWEDR